MEQSLFTLLDEPVEDPAILAAPAIHTRQYTVGGYPASDEQVAILNFAATGEGNVMINSSAGSGKSSLLEAIAKLLHYSVAYFAFNVPNVEQMKKRLKGMDVMTINGLGYRAVLRKIPSAKPSEGKFRELMRDYGKRKDLPYEERFPILTLINAVRLTCTDPEDQEAMETMADRYNLEFHPDWMPHVVELLEIGLHEAINRGFIDFIDQIWLPERLKLPMAKMWENVLVDECQDLSQAQIRLVRKALLPGGRMFAVGDENQAIYGFAFADMRSWRYLHDVLQPTELGMDVTFRCPTSHVRIAQRIVSRIKAAPNAPEGVCEWGAAEQVENAQVGDLIICRRTAPLITTALGFIKRGQAAQVRGRDIGQGLVRVTDEVARFGAFSQFSDALMRWREFQIAKLKAKAASEESFARVDDHVDSLVACAEMAGAQSYDDLRATVTRLFNEKEGVRQLSTVHRAKGSEADNIYVLEAEKLGMSYSRDNDEQRQQARNVEYVGYTRGKKALYLLRAAPKKSDRL